MLESIARNIATAIFIVCAMLVGSLLPEKDNQRDEKQVGYYQLDPSSYRLKGTKDNQSH